MPDNCVYHSQLGSVISGIISGNHWGSQLFVGSQSTEHIVLAAVTSFQRYNLQGKIEIINAWGSVDPSSRPSPLNDARDGTLMRTE